MHIPNHIQFRLGAGAAMLLCCLTLPAVAQTTIFHDTFSRDGSLNGSTPTTTTGGATWTASGTWGMNSANGYLTYYVTSGNASLPYTFSNGTTYRLTADVVMGSGSNGDWLALGFADVPNSAGGPWMLFRNTGGAQTFPNAGTGGSLYNSNPNLGLTRIFREKGIA